MTVAVQQQTWTGRSDEIAVPVLGGEFWKADRSVEGIYDGSREQKIGGYAHKLILDNPVTVDGEEVEIVELPSLTGVKNALQALREKGYVFKRGDLWAVRCVAVKKAKKEDFSDSPQFQIDVIRKG